ncbi:MAG: hypothetical protein RLZZ628_1174, partial [Bacteroidota bacterium]
IENTLSPKTKIEVMTTYAQFIQKGKIEGKIEGKAEGIMEKSIKTLWKARRKGFSMDIIADLTDLPEATIKLWMSRFETLQKCHLDKMTVAVTAKATQLTEQEVTDWWAFFEKSNEKS